MVKRGLVLDHSKSPCEESFIPNKKVKFVFTLMTASISYFSLIYLIIDRLCDLVVRVPGYRSRVWVRFPVLQDFLRSSGSGTESTQPHEYN
jgi:hypothetical protein